MSIWISCVDVEGVLDIIPSCTINLNLKFGFIVSRRACFQFIMHCKIIKGKIKETKVVFLLPVACRWLVTALCKFNEPSLQLFSGETSPALLRLSINQIGRGRG